MSHLQRRYTDFFYREVVSGKKTKWVKTWYLTRRQFIELYPLVPLPTPNAVFPCRHEERDILPKSGKKHNRTKTRMKRKNKARIRARQR
jgi:hypothetical protein